LSGYWRQVSMSANGTKLGAVEYGGRVYESVDIGENWIDVQPNGNQNDNWTTIAYDSNGTIVGAAIFNGHIFVKVNTLYNMALISVQQIAEEEPSFMRIVMLQENISSIILNTDLKLWVSLDDGINYLQATLVNEDILGGAINILVGTLDVSTLTGTQIRYKITTHNYIDTKIYGMAVLWS